MPHYQYLIIGGGMTADAAVQGIRDVDTEGSIGLIGSDPHPPYNRPPLSKGLWKGNPVENIWRETAERGATLHLGRTAKALDAGAKRAQDDRGETYSFDKLLLATGGSPRTLPFGDSIIYYRTFDDYQHLRELADAGKRFAVIGGGFIGSEIAAALTMNGREVTMLFPEEGIGALPYPEELSNFLNGYYQEKGVRVLPGEMVVDVRKQGEAQVLRTKSGREVVADAIVAGIGIVPNTELAAKAGLELDPQTKGIVTDEYLRTSQEDIFTAGDVASFYNPALGKRIRVEHEDNANTMGMHAGRAMAGELAPYTHLPFFYSDLFELGYEAVGELDSRHQTVSDWQEPYRKGVIYYLEDGRVRGVLLWDTWGKVDEARALIAEEGPFEAGDLEGRIQ